MGSKSTNSKTQHWFSTSATFFFLLVSFLFNLFIFVFLVRLPLPDNTKLLPLRGSQNGRNPCFLLFHLFLCKNLLIPFYEEKAKEKNQIFLRNLSQQREKKKIETLEAF